MFWFTLFSFTVWPLMVNIGAILYQGSYFNLILMYFIIALGAKHASKYIRIPIFVANKLIFVFVFIMMYPNASITQNISYMSGSMLSLTIISAALFFVYLYFFDNEKVQSEQDDISKYSRSVEV